MKAACCSRIRCQFVLACLASLAGPLFAADLQLERVTVDPRPPRNPWVKLAGDFNRDGRLDIAIGGQNGPLVWYQNPDWTRTVAAQSGWSTVGGAVADLDGDGDADLVPGAQVWFENPLPQGHPAQDGWKSHRISDIRSHDVAVADLDGDGRLDIVARDQSGFGHETGNRVHFWRQQGLDDWQHHSQECPHGEGLAIADLDRDGDVDVVLGGRWLENPGRIGNWTAHVFTQAWTWADAKVAVGDLDGDGKTDVVLAPAEYQGRSYRLAWFQAPVRASQSEWQEHAIEAPLEAVTHGLALGDMNADGHLDVISARMHQGAAPREVAVHLNRGQGRSWTKTVLSESGSQDILVADFNGDGRLDILGANHGGDFQPVELWLSRASNRPRR